MRALSLLISSACVLAFAACGGSANNDAPQQGAEAAGQANVAGTFSGTVKETVNAGGYTYALVENGGQSLWAAARETELPVGTKVSFSTEMPMQNWHSETLDRTWDTVYFITSFDGEGGAGGDPHAGLDMGSTGHGSGANAGQTVIEAGSIEKAAGGVTVAQLWSERIEHAGSKVTVRGKVVKYNGGIMGRNWVHIQDGSGDAAASTNDLTVTTDAQCAVGDLVTVTGTVVLDKDFGSGYRYSLLIEDAKIEVETPSAGTN